MKLQFIAPLALAALAFVIPLSLPSEAHPIHHASAHAKTTSAPMYACSICHHEVSATEAKKLHYTCPADHGALLPIKAAAKSH